MKARMKRIEIYLSSDSPSDAHLIAIWERLSQEGRGRAQAAFRQALCSLFDQYPMSGQGEPARRQSRRGPAPTWHPSHGEIQQAALSPALFNDETIPVPRQAPAPKERSAVRERQGVNDSDRSLHQTEALGQDASVDDASFPSYPIPSPAIPLEPKPLPARPEVRPAEVIPVRSASSLPQARPSGPPRPQRAESGGPEASLVPSDPVRREVEPVVEPVVESVPAQPSDSQARGGSRYRNLMKRND